MRFIRWLLMKIFGRMIWDMKMRQLERDLEVHRLQQKAWQEDIEARARYNDYCDATLKTEMNTRNERI